MAQSCPQRLSSHPDDASRRRLPEPLEGPRMGRPGAQSETGPCLARDVHQVAAFFVGITWLFQVELGILGGPGDQQGLVQPPAPVDVQNHALARLQQTSHILDVFNGVPQGAAGLGTELGDPRLSEAVE